LLVRVILIGDIKMYNDIFSIGPVTVHGYGLMIAIGVMVAILVADKRSMKRGVNGDYVYTLTLLTVVLGFMCAKVLFIITYLEDFLASPLAFIRGSGFVVFGGIIGGVATIWGYCKYKKLNFVDVFDIVVPSVALAQGFGRIGCLLAGCCYGRETESPIGIVFTHSDFAPNNVRLMPTQIMMSIGDFIIAAVLFWISNRVEKKIMKEKGLEQRPFGCGGQIGLCYLILYSIGRFGVEFFRNDYRGSVGILSTSQFIAVLVALVCAVIYYFGFIRKKKVAEVEDNGNV